MFFLDNFFVVYSFNNVVLVYIEMGELDFVLVVYEEVICLRFKVNSDRIGNLYSNMLSFFLCMGCFDEVEEMFV